MEFVAPLGCFQKNDIDDNLEECKIMNLNYNFYKELNFWSDKFNLIFCTDYYRKNEGP